MIPLSLAPGCFGGIRSFEAGSDECGPCPFSERCERVVAVFRERLQAEGLIAKPRRAKPEIEGVGLVTTLPVKVVRQIERLEKKGINVGESLRAGVNPIDSQPAFLRVACHLLLRMPGGVDRATLRTALVHKLGWTRETAASHVGQVFHLMPAIGAAVEMNGKLIIKRN